MFNPPSNLLTFWEKNAKPKATEHDVQKIQNYVQNLLPELDAQLSKPYTEFIRDYGFVSFPITKECAFWYEHSEEGQKQRFPGSIAFVQQPDRLIEVHQTMTGRKYENSEKFIPDFLLPIGVSHGEDYILLEIGGQHDRIFFWQESFDPWGEGSNTRVGLIADNMYEFINNLEEWPED